MWECYSLDPSRNPLCRKIVRESFHLPQLCWIHLLIFARDNQSFSILLHGSSVLCPGTSTCRPRPPFLWWILVPGSFSVNLFSPFSCFLCILTMVHGWCSNQPFTHNTGNATCVGMLNLMLSPLLLCSFICPTLCLVSEWTMDSIMCSRAFIVSNNTLIFPWCNGFLLGTHIHTKF